MSLHVRVSLWLQGRREKNFWIQAHISQFAGVSITGRHCSCADRRAGKLQIILRQTAHQLYETCVFSRTTANNSVCLSVFLQVALSLLDQEMGDRLNQVK